MAPDTTSGRVTLAVLKNDITHMGGEIERRFDVIERKLDEVCDTANNLDVRVARNEERIKQNAGFLAALSVIGNTIAAAVGSLIK